MWWETTVGTFGICEVLDDFDGFENVFMEMDAS
jgi:hypothetical protein